MNLAKTKTVVKVFAPTGGYWVCGECNRQTWISRFDLERALAEARKRGAPPCCEGPMMFCPAERTDRRAVAS